MIGTLVGLAAQLGVPEPLRKLAAWIAMVVGGALAAVALFFAARAGWRAIVKHHDNTIITTHDAAINAAASVAQAKADRAAGGNDAARMANLAAEQQSLKDARDEATRHDSNPWDAIDNRLR